MPTTSSSAAARSRASRLLAASCATIVSTIWSPIVITGLSAFIALWKTIETSRQRKRPSSASLIASTSWPRKRTSPPVMTAGGWRMRVIAWATVDLPLPDSPARPNTSPGLIDSETPSTARTGPRAVRYSTWRSRISSRGDCSDQAADPGARRATALAGMVHHWRGAAARPAEGHALQNTGRLPLGAQPRIGEFVDGVVDEGKGEGDQRDAGPRRDERPPGSGE